MLFSCVSKRLKMKRITTYRTCSGALVNARIDHQDCGTCGVDHRYVESNKTGRACAGIGRRVLKEWWAGLWKICYSALSDLQAYNGAMSLISEVRCPYSPNLCTRRRLIACDHRPSLPTSSIRKMTTNVSPLVITPRLDYVASSPWNPLTTVN